MGAGYSIEDLNHCNKIERRMLDVAISLSAWSAIPRFIINLIAGDSSSHDMTYSPASGDAWTVWIPTDLNLANLQNTKTQVVDILMC